MSSELFPKPVTHLIAVTNVLLACLGVMETKVAANIVELYAADFSVSGQGVVHDDNDNPPGTLSEQGFNGPSTVSGENWTLTFDESTITTDGTPNEFITTGGVMRVQDFGGTGTVTSELLTITDTGTLTVTGSGVGVGGNAFNATASGDDEGITWFYILNGDTTSLFLDDSDFVGGVDSGTDVGVSFDNIPVVAGDLLSVGFTVTVNGSSDGVEVSELTATIAAIPEPSSFLFGGVIAGGVGGVLLSRRKRSQAA